MTPQRPPHNRFDSYHAHVYFDQSTIEFARKLCHDTGDKFGLQVGRVHERPVGPHTRWSCQILLEEKDLEQVVPWLEQHRGGLSVLIHPDTGDDLADHTVHAQWLGEPVALKLEIF